MKDSVIDFETYYDKNISVVEMGNYNYSRATEAYIVSISIGSEAYCGTIEEMRPMCEQIAKDETVRPVAANSNFDQTWWEKYFPAFKQSWHCVLDQGVFHQFPRSLPGVAKVACNIEVDKTTREEMKGAKYEELSEADQAKVQQYCLNDTLIEAEVCAKLAPMSSFEEKIAVHTRMMNRRGVKINTELVDADKTRLEAMRFEAFKNIPWHAGDAPLSHAALTRYCATKNLPVPTSLAKTNEECRDLMSTVPELQFIIGEMRRFRRANTVLKKIESLKKRITPDDILQTDILYCGAPHTRRWSSKGFNVQNLDKEPIKCTVDGQTVWSRNWLIPRPGHKFLILDLAQIEPRCLNWLCGNEEMMAALRLGFSYYESYARAAKGWKGDAGTLKKEFGKERYTKLKNECLGCGYGMGATKYVTYAAAVGDMVSETEAKAIVDGFRKTNPKVVAMWRHLDNLIKTAARDKSKHLALTMPTGDLLQHFSIRSNANGHASFTIKGDFTHNSMQPRLWGGTLTENITQRMARDVLANAILNLEKTGFPVIFHAHDEVILEVEETAANDYTKSEAIHILTTPPEWAPDLPLGAEGDYADAYTK